MEHAWIYSGRQVDEHWAIVPAAREYNNDATGYVKRVNQLIALLRSTPEDLLNYSRVDWHQTARSLAGKVEDWEKYVNRIGKHHFPEYWISYLKSL